METTNKMRQIRKESGYSQEQMADLMGMSQSAYSHLEGGHRSVKFDEIPKIAKATKKTEEEIMQQLSGCTISTTNHDAAQYNQNIGVYISNNELMQQLLTEKDKTIAAQATTITTQAATIAAQQAQIEALGRA